jgi:SMC interacting uncharacterized protein involved in chromosome segregation
MSHKQEYENARFDGLLHSLNHLASDVAALTKKVEELSRRVEAADRLYATTKLEQLERTLETDLRNFGQYDQRLIHVEQKVIKTIERLKNKFIEIESKMRTPAENKFMETL